MRTETRPGGTAPTNEAGPLFPPPAPRTIHESGLSFAFLVELAAKHLFNGGQLRLVDLSRLTRLPPGILDPVIKFLRTERMCEVAQRTAALADVAYTLTDLGRSRADDYLRRSQYAGPAPVSHSAYVHQVEQQSILDGPVSRAQMRAAFAGCVISGELLDHLGVAMNSGRTLFLHGPAGSGKTYCGARLVKVFGGPVYVPYALCVGGEVVEVFDPLVHKPLGDPDAPVRRMFDRAALHDERWILCHRPAVICGGELAPAMLNLEFDDSRRVHILPAHAKANNGVLVIDDLGRQLVNVHDLLNRWILPLDSRTDYMTLRSGRRFRTPIDVKVIFCTNLRPSQIGDEAFLRRLGYKIHVGGLPPGDYESLFRQVCAELHVPFAAAPFAHLLQRHYAEGRPLLASNPREILEPLHDRARYLGIEPQLDRALIDWAWNNRFAPDRPAAGSEFAQPKPEGVSP